LTRKQAASTIFGLKTEPAITDADKTPGRSYVEPVVYSLRDQLKVAGLEAVMAASPTLDDTLKYVVNDNDFGKMTFTKPGSVLAYELKATKWNGQDKPPAVTNDGKLESKVGMELQAFARDRINIKTNEWVLTNLWLVSAPFKSDAIFS
jgi:hypothetical protein